MALDGLVVPLVTLFDDQGGLDLPKNSRFTRSLLDEGVLHVWALSPWGETASLTPSERSSLLEKVCESGTFYSDTWASLPPLSGEELLQAADDTEAAGVSVLVVEFPAGASAEALRGHLQELKGRTQAPLMGFLAPSGEPSSLTPPLAQELTRAGLLQGVVDFSPNPGSVARFRDGAPEGFSILSGRTAQVYGDLRVGAQGAALPVANALPKWGLALIEAARKDEEARGRELQQLGEQLERLAQAMGMPAGLKALAHALRETDEGYRPPTSAPPTSSREALTQALAPLQGSLRDLL